MPFLIQKLSSTAWHNFGELNGMNDTKKVLVVIDEMITSQAMVSILRCSGYEAAALSSHCSVAELLNAFHPDLVLMGLTLDTMDGYVLCQSIKKKKLNREMKIILIKQVTDPVYPADKINGPDAFLHMPFTLNRLLATVKEQANFIPAARP